MRYPLVLSVLLAACLLPGAGTADERPAKGKLLVATEQIHRDLFTQTVVLLLHYDETGAVGLVVNRPTDVAPSELLPDDDEIAARIERNHRHRITGLGGRGDNFPKKKPVASPSLTVTPRV